jgi:hypothetical protein
MLFKVFDAETFQDLRRESDENRGARETISDRAGSISLPAGNFAGNVFGSPRHRAIRMHFYSTDAMACGKFAVLGARWAGNKANSRREIFGDGRELANPCSEIIDALAA